MPRFNRSRLARTVTLLLVTLSIVRADEFTGMPLHSDPKDLLAPTPQAPLQQPAPDQIAFVPLPIWARGVLMPPLPEALKPMGKKKAVVVAKPVTPEPPKDTTIGTEHTVAGAPLQPAVNTPAMVAVSPFLQWVQTNPQAAAAMARQQANGYQGALGVSTNGPTGTPAPAANGDQNPYWLPPLIDSSSIEPVRGSSASYSTPQR